MKLFSQYLKSKLKIILLFVLFSVIIFLSFLLYRLPAEPAVYTVTVCAVIGLTVLALDYSKTLKKHRTFTALKKSTIEMIDDLPVSSGIIENDYAELITKLRSDAGRLADDNSTKYQDMVDYYTVWAHQIKTPISAMKLTLQSEDSPVSRKVSAELFKIEQYVEMVLAFLRLDSQSHDYVFKKHDLDEIIRNSVRKFASEFIMRKLSLDYEPVSYTLTTDDKWLSFVIEQILSNALKYTKRGSIRIALSDDTLYVSDTGIGISKSDLPRIFEKGFTGFNGRTDKSASGIGLYLCKRICDNLGIGISIESELDRGTTVMLDFAQKDLKFE